VAMQQFCGNATLYIFSNLKVNTVCQPGVLTAAASTPAPSSSNRRHNYTTFSWAIRELGQVMKYGDGLFHI